MIKKGFNFCYVYKKEVQQCTFRSYVRISSRLLA
jgi:hypothetical protein